MADRVNNADGFQKFVDQQLKELFKMLSPDHCSKITYNIVFQIAKQTMQFHLSLEEARVAVEEAWAKSVPKVQNNAANVLLDKVHKEVGGYLEDIVKQFPTGRGGRW